MSSASIGSRFESAAAPIGSKVRWSLPEILPGLTDL